MIRATLASPASTGRFARALAARLGAAARAASLRAPIGATQPGPAASSVGCEASALVTLEGELGTGKTTVVRAALRALGVRDVVTSPSFTLAQSYVGRRGLHLHHLDLYRLAPGEDVALFAWDDYLEPGSIAFVEWPEAGAAELPLADVRVRLYHETPRSRLVEVAAGDAFERGLLQDLHATGIAATRSGGEDVTRSSGFAGSNSGGGAVGAGGAL